MLFLIYINDIANNLSSFTRLFADDTSLSYSSASHEMIEATVNSDLLKIKDWANNWLVKFNPNKTKFLFISNTLSSDDINLLFQNDIIESC